MPVNGTISFDLSEDSEEDTMESFGWPDTVPTAKLEYFPLRLLWSQTEHQSGQTIW